MEIDLNQYHIEIKILNIELEEVYIKLPKSEESLEFSLLEKKIVTNTNTLGYLNFENKMKSVKGFKKLNIEVEEPLNIYYLNLYLNLLKERDIKLEENEKLSTEILKSKISSLLKLEDILDYQQIKDLKNKQKEKKDLIYKPQFSLEKLLNRHHKRKEG